LVRLDGGFPLAAQKSNKTKLCLESQIPTANSAVSSTSRSILKFAILRSNSPSSAVVPFRNDLVEAEWFRFQAAQQGAPAPQYPQAAYYGMPKM